MTTYPHTPAGLASLLAEAGQLTDPRWRAAFEAVPRHVFVPRFLLDDGTEVAGAVPADRLAWLAAVYSDLPLIIQTRPVPGTDLRWPTSSSTRPSLMARMLHLLDVAHGHRVLEIGTGSGYNAALLCHRLGDGQVTSIDIHPDLVMLAADRLAGLGYRPSLVVGDGTGGAAVGGPYQRIIATGAVGAVPAAWIDQLAPGGLIVADLRGELSSSLCVLHKRDQGTVEGRFLTVPGHFMWLRPVADNPLRDGRSLPATIDHNGALPAPVRVDPTILESADLRFLLQHLHAVEQVWAGQRGLERVTHLHAADGSWAEVATGQDTSLVATQGGPRQLWRLTEDTVQLWDRLGRPARDRFGLTASRDSQQLWLDTPYGARRWRIG